MITGVVRAGAARLRLKVRGPRGRGRMIEAIIDTGYSGWLSLPPDLVSALGLPRQGFVRGILADGSETIFDVYEATVLWDGAARGITIDEADNDPLVGMDLLKGYELRMQVRPRGKVTIKRLP